MTDPENTNESSGTSRILVLGIYNARQDNHAERAVDVFAASGNYDVTQKWVALGERATEGRLAEVTVDAVRQGEKFAILNALIEKESLEDYDYVVVTDDDITFPDRFLDRYLAIQDGLGWALAQPARTNDSYLDHPIVEVQWGIVGRQTWFVEIGPLFSVHRSAYPEIFPFDLTSGMGWGYSNVWASRFTRHGLRMGIVDALPVAHNLRRPAANYDWDKADAARRALLEKHPYYPIELCFRTLAVVQDESDLRTYASGAPGSAVAVSVVLPVDASTHHLAASLDSLCDSRLTRKHFEVIVADEGPSTDVEALCRAYEDRLDLSYLPIAASGSAATKNAALFATRGNIVIFLDPDHCVDPDTIGRHLQAHAETPAEGAMIVGKADWHADLDTSPLMRCLRNRQDRLLSRCKVGELLDAHPPLRPAYSFKRTFLVRHGGFRQNLAGGAEDLELQLRLKRFGLQVVYDPCAISYLARSPEWSDVLTAFDHLMQSRALVDYPIPDAGGLVSSPRIPESGTVEDLLSRLRSLEGSRTDFRGHRTGTIEMERLYEEIFRAKTEEILAPSFAHTDVS